MIVLSKMLIAATIGAGAMLAGTANNITKVPSNQAGTTVFDENTRYFEFVGTNGQENQPAQWQEITATEYSLNPCNGNVRGCVLATTSVTGDSLSGYHPTIIPVDIDPSNPENMEPKVDQTNVQEVRNRTLDYSTE